MKRETFNDYINRFNAQDMSAFEDYIDPNATITNGPLVIQGREGMKEHYSKIWKSITEELTVERFVSDDQTLAIQLRAHFTARQDDKNSPFGAVKDGECFDYHGIVMYRIENNKFTDIKVSYLSFSRTNLEGKTIEMGIVH